MIFRAKPSKHEVHKVKLWISGSCIDTDDGKTDSAGFGCEFYARIGRCGRYDNSDFTAASLCCGCGGGIKGNLTLFK